MRYSAKRGIAIARRLSIRPSVTLMDQDHIRWQSWKLIARTPNTFALRSPNKAIHLLPGEHGDILEHKSGNISETHKDREKVTMEGL